MEKQKNKNHIQQIQIPCQALLESQGGSKCSLYEDYKTADLLNLQKKEYKEVKEKNDNNKI